MNRNRRTSCSPSPPRALPSRPPIRGGPAVPATPGGHAERRRDRQRGQRPHARVAARRSRERRPGARGRRRQREDSNIIVSDVGIQPTMLKLIDEKELDRSYLNYIRDLVPGWAFTAVRYFLNKKVVKEQMAMCWADYTWMTMDLFNKVKAGQKLEEEVFFFTVPSNYDPSMAPQGKQCVVAGTVCSPDPKAPEIKMQNDLLDKMIEKIYPGFMDACFEKQAHGSGRDFSSYA